MAIRKLFINTSASADAALVTSFRSFAQAEAPSFRRDDTLDVELHFLTETTQGDNENPFIYLDPTGWTVKVGAGDLDDTPDSGTWTFTDNAASQTTSAIAYDASAATVQTRLRADCSTNFSACTVTGNAGGPWTIDRVTTGAFATNPSGTATALSPSGSKVVTVNTEDGTSSLSEKWQVSLSKALPIYKESGWSALASASVTVTTLQAGSATQNAIYRIAFNSDAYSGGVSVNFTSQTVTATVTFNYNATAEEVVTAFEKHPSWVTAALDGVRVIKNGPGDYSVECVGTDIDLAATTALATSSNTLKVPVGLSGRLSCNTAVFNSMFTDNTDIETHFEVEIARAASQPETVLHVTDAVFAKDLIRNVAGSSTATQTFPATNEVELYLSTISGLTGGTATDLDSVSVANYSEGQAIRVRISDKEYHYILDDTGALPSESAPTKIIPDTASGTKYWLLHAWAEGRQTLWIPASDMVARTTAGAASGTTETTTNKIMVQTLDFDSATDEFSQVTIGFPESWDEGTITAQFIWTAASGSGDVVWTIVGTSISNDEPLDAAFGTSVSVTDTLLSANDSHLSPETAVMTVGNSPAAGDLVVFQFSRDADNVSDTLGVDAKLIGVRLHFIRNESWDSTI